MMSADPLLTFRPSGGSAGIAATPCWPERQDRTLSTKCAFRQELVAVARHGHFAQLRGHWADLALVLAYLRFGTMVEVQEQGRRPSSTLRALVKTRINTLPLLLGALRRRRVGR